MKKLFVALLCLFAAKSAIAQKDLLSFDEHNKYIYYQVVEQPGLTANTFQNRALYFLKINYPKNKIEKNETSAIKGSGKLLMLTGLAVAKHIDGEVNYTFNIEYKDQKYRYWLNDFVFTPYKVDRYGNSVPEPGIDIPLEDGASKLEKVQLASYLDQTGKFSKAFGDKLKKFMLMISAAPIKADKKKVITTKDW
ncbi:DUF4468 domain-containing protein [Mucilaginibacter sp.]